MRQTTLDPISLEDVTDPEQAPFVVEGEGDSAIEVYFQSEDNKREYLALEVHGSTTAPG
ncbi:MAG: hypothetical protein PVJ03_00405 [Chromatiaceae bacterium]|jgi:hypothetical protein